MASARMDDKMRRKILQKSTISERPSGGHLESCIRTRGKTWEDQTNAEWNVSPTEKRVFFRLNLLQREPSCSLVKFCSTDSPTHPALSSCRPKHTHRQTLVNKAVATKAWSEKRKQPLFPCSLAPSPPPSLCPSQPCERAADESDKVVLSVTGDGQWSGVATMLQRGSVDFLKRIHKTLQLLLEKQIIQLLVTCIYTVDEQEGSVGCVLSSS